jgi:hypothetical protein
MSYASPYTSFADICNTVIKEENRYPLISERPQIIYLNKYLQEIDCKSYVLEENFIDDDFFDDYSGYYSQRNSTITKEVIRVHFFCSLSSDVTKILENAQQNSDNKVDECLSSSYLGYVVIRPLPITLIGMTCLKHYNSLTTSKENRLFPCTRKYDVNLLGVNLNVTTVAFQEQDSEIAACSTTSIWYALHAFNLIKDIERIDAPYTISEIASSSAIIPPIGESHRAFPASGLTLPQMLSYFKKINIDYISKGFNNQQDPIDFLNQIKTFLLCGFPCILVGNLSIKSNGELKKLGMHAITVLGYNDNAEIQKLYAHDDNLGPFTRLEFQHKPTITNPPSDLFNFCCLHSKIESIDRFFTPSYLITPIDVDCRYPYEVIIELGNLLTNTLSQFLPLRYDSKTKISNLAYNINLQNSFSFKKELRGTKKYNQEIVKELLEKQLPKYIWILEFNATINHNSESLFIAMFDATSLKQDGNLICLDWSDREVSITSFAIILGFIDQYVFGDKKTNSTRNFLCTPETAMLLLQIRNAIPSEGSIVDESK